MTIAFNLDAELALLSIIVKNPDSIYELQDVKPVMLSSLPAQKLLSELLDMRSRGLITDINLVVEYLKSKNELHLVGGQDFIEHLSKQDFDRSNLREYEKIVINSFKARSLISALSDARGRMTSIDSVIDVIPYLRDVISNLESFQGGNSVVDFKDALKDTWEDIVRKVNDGDPIKVTTGFGDLDAVTGGFSPGDLWVVAGRPSMGKSAWMCNSVLNSAKAGNPALIFSLEMNKVSLAQRFLSIETGIPISNIRLGTLNNPQMSRLAEAIEVIKNLPIYIESSFSVDLGYITSTIRKYQNIKGVKLVFLDYIQLLAERSNSAVHELGQITRDLKLISNDVGVTTIVLSQLNRGVESRDDKRPMLSDLRQSGNIEEDADIVIMLYRDAKYNPNTKYKDTMENIIRKHRNGPIGMIPLRFEDETNITRTRADG